MNILFLFIFPIAIILISIVLQKLLNSPILVAIPVFAVFLILAYTVYTTDFIIYVIAYTIIAYITAQLVKLFCCIKNRIRCSGESMCPGSNDNLDEAVESLQDSIGTLEDNISDLNDLLSQALGNNRYVCNKRIRR